MLECCVFGPAFGCCVHLKAGRTTFFSHFQAFLFIFTFFSDFTPEINRKTKKLENGWKKRVRNTQHLRLQIKKSKLFTTIYICAIFVKTDYTLALLLPKQLKIIMRRSFLHLVILGYFLGILDYSVISLDIKAHF